MDDRDLMIFALAGLAFLAVAGVGLAFTGGESAAASKRARQFQASQKSSKGKRRTESSRQRSRQTQQMIANLREDQKAQRKSLMPRDIETRLQQAGLDIPTSTFWIASVIFGITCGVLAYLSEANGITVQGIELRSRPIVVGAAALAGTIGVPRWVLGMLSGRRNAKQTAQFADAIDIIVRGVKSGLPLNESLQVIARESPEPLSKEFQDLADNLRMGNTLEQALAKFFKRVPLPEVNFFVIVLNIQSKAGGNLSEALGNLSQIIRQRKMMREKIKALSSEAKASAMIIGSLPFAVGTMVYITTPDYMLLLVQEPMGHMILALGAFLMFLGIFVMRKMINFDF